MAGQVIQLFNAKPWEDPRLSISVSPTYFQHFNPSTLKSPLSLILVSLLILQPSPELRNQVGESLICFAAIFGCISNQGMGRTDNHWSLTYPRGLKWRPRLLNPGAYDEPSTVSNKLGRFITLYIAVNVTSELHCFLLLNYLAVQADSSWVFSERHFPPKTHSGLADLSLEPMTNHV